MRMVRLGQTYQGAMMAKNAKKNRSKALQKATSKGANHPKQAQKPQNSPDPQVQGDANAEVTAPVERCESLPPMDLHTRMGILDDEIYTQLIEPAFQAFALEDEETGLRMLAESVVSAIAAREDYAKFRKLDDICTTSRALQSSNDERANASKYKVCARIGEVKCAWLSYAIAAPCAISSCQAIRPNKSKRNFRNKRPIEATIGSTRKPIPAADSICAKRDFCAASIRSSIRR